MGTKLALTQDTRTDMESYKYMLDGALEVLMGDTTIGDQDLRLYRYDASSTAVVDNVNVIDAVGAEVGRFVRVHIESEIKRVESYTGTTTTNGQYTVVYPVPFSNTPIVIPTIVNGSPTNSINITASSETGFTITVNNEVNILGLLPTYPALSGVNVDVFVSER